MTLKKWEQIKDKIEGSFKDVKISQEKLADVSGGQKEVVEFSGPLGKMKLEFIEKPKLIGEKTTYSRRIGADVQVKKEYNPDEVVSYMKAYKQDVNGEWEEIESSTFS